MQSLQSRVFELVENKGGHAASTTTIRFSNVPEPCTAIYSGPNISFGQAIVKDGEMLYQAIELDGTLRAGRAKIAIKATDGNPREMHLHWSWLTGEKSSGVSVWQEIEPN